METVLIYSGGLDSTTLLYHLLDTGHRVRCLTIDYGQRHRREIESAEAVCGLLSIEHRVADLSALRPLMGGSALTDDIEVPEGHYEEESMKATVVPNRNMLMLSVAIAWAVSTKSDFVAYAAHGGDHAIYPDCRPEFAEAMNAAAKLCDWHKVEILRPFIRLDKGEIVRHGVELSVPFELTWTCYRGGEKACGKCGSCRERLEAFEGAGLSDPLSYEI